MLLKNKSVAIVTLVALVNMLGYGIIIPLLYGYSRRFGLSDFQNGLLFAAYSVCQFISTPIIGRMSDKYGRKPLLVVSVAGTAMSFITMAFAPNATFLFLARILDGLTAGNVPVIFAIISDTTKPEERPKAFGLVGSAFSFGFIFGPAIAALTIGSGAAVPFLIAAAITIVATLLAIFYLPETNTHSREVAKGKLFDFAHMWRTLFDPNTGVTFMISLVFFLAFSCAVIYGFQPFTIEVLKITQSQNAQLFTLFGIIGLFTQNVLVGLATKKLGTKHAFSLSMLITAIAFVVSYLAGTLPLFIVGMVILGVANSIAQTLIPVILSQEADAKSQGTIMGLNTSYQSVGMIVGPILGGVVAANFSPKAPFLVGAILVLVCYALTFWVLRPGIHKESAF